MEFLSKSKRSLFLAGCFAVAVGLCLLIWPEILVAILCYLIGTGLLIFGLVKVVSYFVKHSKGDADSRYDLAFGLFFSICGILFVGQPHTIVNVIQTILGLVILADAALKFQAAIDAKHFSASNWWFLLVLSAVTAAVGVLLVWDPFGASMMVLLGVALLVDGLQNILSALFIGKYLRIETAPETVYYRTGNRK